MINPEEIEVIGQFMNGDVTLFKGCVFDFLTIQWDNVNLNQHDLDLWLPSSLPVSLTSKFFLRKMFDRPSTLFRIIAYSPQNGKVRPLTSLYKMLSIEEVVSSDIRTHQLEIAFSDPGEQQLCDECHPKIEESVCDSGDDVPELVSLMQGPSSITACNLVEVFVLCCFLSALNFWGMFVRVYPKIVQGLTFLNSVKHITIILARCTS